MKGLLITVSALLLVAGLAQGQFLSLPEELKDLVPAEIQEVLEGLLPEQLELLKKVDKDKLLGARAVKAASALYEKIKQLPAAAGGEHVKNYYLLLAQLDGPDQKELLKKLKAGYQKLDAGTKSSVKKLFPSVVETLESPEYVRLARL